MPSEYVMLVVSVPITHADQLRNALGAAGAGKIGNYTHCSFSYQGTGRFFPGEGSNPEWGAVGEHSLVDEERIEMLCERSKMQMIIAALREAHPYEEPAFHYFPVDIV